MLSAMFGSGIIILVFMVVSALLARGGSREMGGRPKRAQTVSREGAKHAGAAKTGSE
jgi:hypothetical protein